MSYAIKISGRISVLDLDTGKVIPPVEALLGSYPSRDEAERAMERVRQGRSRNLKEIVEV